MHPTKPVSIVLALILALEVSQVACRPACQDIQLSGYKFDLSSLRDLQETSALTGSEFVRISMCWVIGCNNTLANGTSVEQFGYVLLRQNQQTCQSYTYSETGPLQQMYSLLDPIQPQKGLSISYPTSFTTIPRTSTQQSTDNTTITITTIQFHSASTTININCNKLSQQLSSCSKVSTLLHRQQINQTYWVKIINDSLTCSMFLGQGCPVLAVNHFWGFLLEKAIAFAIVMWVCALFLIVLGYIAIRVTILLYGVFTASCFGIIYVAENYHNFYLESNGLFIFTVCLSVVMGLLFGIFLLTVPKLGYINIGVFVAAIFSLLLQNSVLFLTGSLLAFYITFGVTAFVMAVIALMELRYFIIICTSFTGAFMIIRPLGFYLPGYPNQLISGKNFLISVKTPWQFYLYLASILILTGIGIAIQRCLTKKVIGKNKEANNQYYLEEEGTVRDKLKKIFEFKEIKDMINAGKQEFVQLKNMLTDDKNIKYSEYKQDDDEEDDGGHYIEMEKMEKIQNQKSKDKQKQKQIEKQREWEKEKEKEKEKVNFVAPKSKGKDSTSKKNQKQIEVIEYIGSEEEESEGNKKTYKSQNSKNK